VYQSHQQQPEEVEMHRSTTTRLVIALVTASALVLLTAGATLGKCEHDPGQCAGMIVTLDPGGGLTSGMTQTVGIMVLEDEQPYDASGVSLTFTRASDGATVRAEALPTNLPGRWEAAIELPAGGTWTARAQVVGAGYAGTFELDSVAVATGTTPPAGPVTGTPVPALPPALLLVTLVALVAGLAGLVAVNRRKQAAAAS
jgi:hypothetical protein